MYLKVISFSGVRNLSPATLDFSPKLNLIKGNNGAGKSSVLEAISLLTSARSFRTAKMDLVVSHGIDEFVLFGRMNPEMRLGLQHQRKAKANVARIDGQPASSLSQLAKLLPTQVICPESYHLIDAGPVERRKYLDWCLFHVEHSYVEEWKNYRHVLSQRNALLRQSKVASQEEWNYWDGRLCHLANLINQSRIAMLKSLESLLDEVFNLLNVNFCQDLRLSYYSGYTGELLERLRESFHSDRERGVTQYGPHRADLRIKVDGLPAKDSLSRGQKKVLINALYLAQTKLLKQETNADSLFIIDDFTSELDLDNQTRLLTTLLAQDNVQIILSCLHLDALKLLEKGYNDAHLFHVEHGRVTPIAAADSQCITQ